jgi:hypothetical protein
MGHRVTFLSEVVPYLSRVARGEISGESVVRKFGRNASVGTSFIPIWLANVAITLFQVAGDTIDIVSDSAADDHTTGTGAWVLRLSGVDENWDSQTEDLDFTDPAKTTTALNWGWINSGAVLQAGTARNNVGNITGTTTSTSAAAFKIAAGQGRTQQTVYAVPNGYQLEVHGLRLGGSSTKPVDFEFVSELDPLDRTSPVGRQVIDNIDGVDTAGVFVLSPPMIVPGGSLFWVEGKVAAGSASASASFDAVLTPV